MKIRTGVAFIMVELSSIITAFFSLYIAISSLKRLILPNSSIMEYAILFIFVFNCIPIILDLIIGVPQYSSYYIGLNIALQSEITAVIYNFYIIFVLLFLHIYAKKNKEINKFTDIKLQDQYEHNAPFKELLRDYIYFILILLPLFHVIFSPYVSHFYEYGSFGMRGITDSTFTELNTFLRLFSLVFLASWLLNKKKQGGVLEFVMVLFYLFVLIWIDGKRNIIAFIMVLLFFVFRIRNRFKPKKVFLTLIISGLLILSVSSGYQILLRSDFIDYSDFHNAYNDYRLNFGRDDVTKLAIYSELDDDFQILNYRGESILSLFIFWIPRSVWPDKPLQHYNYITSAAMGVEPHPVPWGITPSIFDQLVANFSFFGILLVPFLLIWLTKIGDKAKSQLSKLLMIFILSGILTMGIVYIMPFIISLLLIKYIFPVLIQSIKKRIGDE